MGEFVSEAHDSDGTSIGVSVIEGGVSNHLPIGVPSGHDLAWKFFGLGSLRGKTTTEIIAGVGLPTSRRSMAKGEMLLQWQVRGYHMALLFNSEERVVKVTPQSARVVPRCRAYRSLKY
jgi:hypothetical protein